MSSCLSLILGHFRGREQEMSWRDAKRGCEVAELRGGDCLARVAPTAISFEAK